MVSVEFTPVLKNFFPSLQSEHLEVESIKELLDEIEKKYPGINSYIVDESGNLREHVNVYIGDEPLQSKDLMREKLKSDDKVLIYQAISGG